MSASWCEKGCVLSMSKPLLDCYQHARIQKKIFRRDPTFFLVNEWIQIPLKSGHHQPASERPFKWCFPGVPMTLNAGNGY